VAAVGGDFRGHAVGAPKSTVTEIVEKRNKGINAGLGEPGISTLADLGAMMLAGPPGGSSPKRPRSGAR
jgi:hypothetical protein